MSSIAIVIGNTTYANLNNLECCSADVTAICQLLEATKKYDRICRHDNETADEIKASIRDDLKDTIDASELFFYYTGHGSQVEGEFFLCAPNFDLKRPNETGLSTTELHTLLRLPSAELVVKVIDACNSGAPLIKSQGQWHLQDKGFSNLIQIASCLESQNSLTGDPLSLFTERFIGAALRKADGIVYYTDIISTLRDDFLEDASQTPFFVSQHTGREQFLGDARYLSGLRETIQEKNREPVGALAHEQQVSQPLSLLDRLTLADTKVIQPDSINEMSHKLFDEIIAMIEHSEFSDFFRTSISEHSEFKEPTAKQFILRTMADEKRPDNFVTAKFSRRRKQRNPLFGTFAFDRYEDDDAYVEESTLELNCAMERCQLSIILTPNFTSLQRIVLVVTRAPSLDHCYIFEIATQHLLHDFDKFDVHGSVASRRWWKIKWNDDTAGIVTQISEKLIEIVRAQLESAEKRLGAG